jgi:3-deoxy-D-manno-octulosonate 8-phosphate phosphatase (KDO 8-P phosphatase)
MQSLELVHLFDKLKEVRAFVFDVDGVFTDNTVLVTESGELLRTRNVRDGQAVKWAIAAGFPVGIITGGKSAGMLQSLKDLGITHIYAGVEDKTLALTDFLQYHQIKVADVLYIGDDIPDLPVLKRVGVAVAPNDAVNEVLQIVDYVSPFDGGKGVVRDVIEKVLKLQGKWVGTVL